MLHERAALAGPAAPRLLPSGLIWVYVVAPVGLAVLMSQDLLATPLPALLRKVGAEYIPFVALGAAFHGLYRFVMPTLLQRFQATAARVTAHVVMVTLLAVLVALAVHPLMVVASGTVIPLRGFVVASVVISAMCIFPALTVQHLRVRAAAAERALLAEQHAVLQAQLDALQARTDPHFLFNGLNTVAALIPEDPRQAERILERLAELFRYALESSRVREVSLARELEVICDYLDIQRARFGDRLRTHVELDETLADVRVPPLLLQPLVENAIMHGMSGSAPGAGQRKAEISVTVRREADAVAIEVTDNGPGPGASQHSGTGSALAGIIERVRLRHGPRAQLQLLAMSAGGCRARLTFPLPVP